MRACHRPSFEHRETPRYTDVALRDRGALPAPAAVPLPDAAFFFFDAGRFFASWSVPSYSSSSSLFVVAMSSSSTVAGRAGGAGRGLFFEGAGCCCAGRAGSDGISLCEDAVLPSTGVCGESTGTAGGMLPAGGSAAPWSSRL